VAVAQESEFKMPKDHYVSQVHLRKFYSPALNNRRMFAVRKSDLHTFTAKSEEVCRIHDGNTNNYLEHPRAIEDFLKIIEPKYTAAVRAAENGELDNETVFTIAGFVSSVLVCSPAGARVGSAPIENVVDAYAEHLDRTEKLEPVPDGLGVASYSELAAKVVVDPKYSQALGISKIIRFTEMFGNCDWEILLNREASSPFFTSDFPAAVERSKNQWCLDRIVPLSPTVAVRMIPDRTKNTAAFDLTFPDFRYRVVEMSRSDVVKVNRLLVRCAEELVFFRDDMPWVHTLIEKNRDFWSKPDNHHSLLPDGSSVVLTEQRIQRRNNR
jgi:hypothetical protein